MQRYIFFYIEFSYFAVLADINGHLFTQANYIHQIKNGE